MASDGKSPVEVMGTSDPGDEVQRRFRYQATYSAKLALGLLLPTTGIIEVYCEHHDDVLLRMSDGKFRPCQVKTREPGYGPFKSNEAAIVDSIGRFIDLEMKFPGRFD